MENVADKSEKVASDLMKSGEKMIGDAVSEVKKTLGDSEQKIDSTFSKIGSVAENTVNDVKNGLNLRNF